MTWDFAFCPIPEGIATSHGGRSSARSVRRLDHLRDFTRTLVEETSRTTSPTSRPSTGGQAEASRRRRATVTKKPARADRPAGFLALTSTKRAGAVAVDSLVGESSSLTGDILRAISPNSRLRARHRHVRRAPAHQSCTPRRRRVDGGRPPCSAARSHPRAIRLLRCSRARSPPRGSLADDHVLLDPRRWSTLPLSRPRHTRVVS